MNKQEYAEYLKSEHWELLKRWKRSQHQVKRCAICNRTHKIEYHHLRYKKIYDCNPEDIVMLCRECHGQAHIIMDCKLLIVDGKPVNQKTLVELKPKRHFQIIKEAVLQLKENDNKYEKINIGSALSYDNLTKKTRAVPSPEKKKGRPSRDAGTNPRAMGTNPREVKRQHKREKALEKQTEETALRRLRRAYMRKHPDAGYKEMQEAGLF